MSFFSELQYMDCPWCGTKNISMNILLQSQRVGTASGIQRDWTYLVCPRCGGAVSVETNLLGTGAIRVVPEDREESDVGHLPSEVERHYRSALTVLAAGVPSSAAVELRKTLEAAAQSQGVTVSPLARAIEKLAEEGLITKDFTSVLGHIRKIGNVGAHASDEDVSEEEAALALRFTTQVLRNLFEIPAELESLDAGPEQQPEGG